MIFDRAKKIDLIVILLIFAITATISSFFSLAPLWVGTLTLLSPSIYLMIREPKNALKLTTAVLVFGALFSFFFDFLVTANQGWIVTRLVIPYQILGVLPIDDVLGFMLMTLFVITFYDHFLDDYRSSTVSPNIWKAALPALLIGALLVVLYTINPAWLRVPYVYLVTGLVAIIRLVKVCVTKQRYIVKFAYISAFFFLIWLTLELICLKSGGWFFPGQYIGQIYIGNLMFPLEEFVFWLLLYSATLVAFYEYYEDKMR